jgi:hypothetical protein
MEMFAQNPEQGGVWRDVHLVGPAVDVELDHGASLEKKVLINR